MSREVRRVPPGWQHPTEPNPHWRQQAAWRLLHGKKGLTLHAPEVRFVPLFDDYLGALADWEARGEQIRTRTGCAWTFRVEFHLTGYQGPDDTEPTVYPFYVWVGDDETEVNVRDEDHLAELLNAQHAADKPDPASYMPVWETDDLGWVLYETVSEGTPITPVFPTAAALVEHLVTVGTEWGGPLRRSAAEQIVSGGGTFGSLIVIGDRVLNPAEDADLIAGSAR